MGALEYLVFVSIAILAIFLVELSLQIFAFGAKEWLSDYMHVFDLVITLITFLFEIIYHKKPSVQSMFGLLIVFRLWRLVRVIHVTTEALELKHENEEEEKYELL